jgi:hypothetical protein
VKERNASMVLVEMQEGKRPLRNTRQMREDDTEICGVDWIYLPHDTNQWAGSFEQCYEFSGYAKCWEILKKLSYWRFLKKH